MAGGDGCDRRRARCRLDRGWRDELDGGRPSQHRARRVAAVGHTHADRPCRRSGVSRCDRAQRSTTAAAGRADDGRSDRCRSRGIDDRGAGRRRRPGAARRVGGGQIRSVSRGDRRSGWRRRPGSPHRRVRRPRGRARCGPRAARVDHRRTGWASGPAVPLWPHEPTPRHRPAALVQPPQPARPEGGAPGSVALESAGRWRLHGEPPGRARPVLVRRRRPRR